MTGAIKHPLPYKEIPEGTVTFLFTDIEGSTLLLKQLGADRYGLVLADQRRILREAFEQFKGSEIDTQGDSFFVSFARATQAVSATVEIQRALDKHKWPEEVEVRVRMGLHTGEPLKAEEGYVGIDVHRAARIAHAGHGGQVLLSETTSPLVVDELPEGVELLDLGRHWLKDMHRPERIRQLVIEGLPSEFPPLKSPGMELMVPQHNLPAPVNSFVGREKELDEIASLLEDPDTRLLTLVGPPGVGKTRLALESAMRQVANFTAGAWLVELAPVEKPARILPCMAAALGVEIAQGSGMDLESALETSLNRGPLLLLVDNCEHLLEGVAPLLGKLLRHCPQLTVLATSREWLRVTGEVTYHVPAFDIARDGLDDLEQLGDNEAMKLFAERAQAIQPDFAFTSENVQYVSSICRHLDGIALVIELAAARLRVMSERELAENLGRRFALLTSGGRDVLPKMRTLRASLEWSYELLNPLEQEVLDRLSVFRGGCALPEATCVCGGEGVESWEVMEILASLIEKSLVSRKEGSSGSTRYDTLESIIELGREHLQEGGTWLETRKRHAEVYSNLAEEAKQFLSIKNDAQWMERLVEDEANIMTTLYYWDEVDNVEKVIHFVWHLIDFFFHRYHLMAEAKTIVQRVLSLNVTISPSIYGLGLLNLQTIAYSSGEYQIAKSYTDDVLQIATKEEDEYLLMQEIAADALNEFQNGNKEAAIPKIHQALKLVEQKDEELNWLLNLFLVGTKPTKDRQEPLKKFVEEAKIKANSNMLAVASQDLGWIKLNLGELEVAEEYYWTSFRAWKRIKNRRFQSSKLASIAYIYKLQGHYKHSNNILEQSTQVGKLTGESGTQIWRSIEKAELNFYRGDLPQVQNDLQQLLSQIKDDTGQKINYLFNSGQLKHIQGKINNAYENLIEACESVDSYQGSYGWPAVYCLLAVVLHELGEDNTALQNFQQALEILFKEYEHPEMLETLEWLALYCADLEEWGVAARFLAANDSLRQVSGIVPPVPYRELWAQTRERVKENLSQGEYQEAWDEALAIEQLSIPDYALDQLARLETDGRFVTHAAN